MHSVEEHSFSRVGFDAADQCSLFPEAVIKLQLISLCLCLLISCSSAALAQPQSSFDEDSRRQYVADLKQTALKQISDFNAAEMQLHHPDSSRANVYINVPENDFNLQSLKVSLAGQVLAEYHYTVSEIASLQGHGMHRALRIALNTQQALLAVEFRGTQPQGQRGNVAVQGAVQIMLDTRYAPMSIVVPVTAAAHDKTVELSLSTVLALAQNTNPQLGMAKFLRARGNTSAAITELLAINHDSTPAYHLELARNYLDFDMQEYAVATLRKALGAGADWKDAHGLALRLAELDYQRRYHSRAYQLLQFLREQNLTQTQLLRWQDIQSRLLISGGQFDQACEVLSNGKEDLETITETKDVSPEIMYLRFNYAICLLKTDEIARGWWLMARIGQTASTTPEMLALRDRANLLLGYNFLNESQTDRVKEVVQRIRLDSPFRAHALLLLGWMELASEQKTNNGQASPGTRDKSAKQQDKPANTIQYNPFSNTKLPATTTSQAHAALAVWQEIVKDLPQGEAVQEAIVAIAFALSRLGKTQDAYSAYQRAVDYLEQSHQHLEESFRADSLNLHDIGAGNLQALPAAPWVTQALASHKFQEHLQNYLTLDHLHKTTQSLQARYSRKNAFRYGTNTAPKNQELQLLNSLNANLGEQITQQATLAREVVNKALAKQITRLEKYTLAARLGVVAYEDLQNQ